jgi:hypothetical protein
VQSIIDLEWPEFVEEFSIIAGFNKESVGDFLDGADARYTRFVPEQGWPTQEPGYLWATRWASIYPELADGQMRHIYRAVGALWCGQLVDICQTMTQGQYNSAMWNDNPDAALKTMRTVFHRRINSIYVVHEALGLTR